MPLPTVPYRRITPTSPKSSTEGKEGQLKQADSPGQKQRIRTPRHCLATAWSGQQRPIGGRGVGVQYRELVAQERSTDSMKRWIRCLLWYPCNAWTATGIQDASRTGRTTWASTGILGMWQNLSWGSRGGQCLESRSRITWSLKLPQVSWPLSFYPVPV